MSTPLTIAKRLGLGFGLMLGLMILVTLIGVKRVNVIEQTLTNVSEDSSVKQRYAINLRGSVHDRAIAIRDAILVRDDTRLTAVLRLIEQLDQAYQQSAKPMDETFQRLGASADDQQMLAAIKAQESQAQALTRQLIGLRKQGDLDRAQGLLLEQVSPAYQEWLKRINSFIDSQERAIGQDIHQVRETAGGFARLMLLATAVAALICLIASYVIIRNIKSTLGAEPEAVATLIRGLAKGELNGLIETRYPNSVMGALRLSNQHLSETIEQVRAAATELTGSSAQLSRSSQDNQQQMHIQTEETERMATAVTQMAATGDEIARYAATAAAASKTADGEVESGKRVVEHTASAMHELSQMLDQASSSVLKVSEDSQSIETIVQVINSIAERTNLLALNAAIEAARAGEFGRGFAVVADEVRSLATRTQDSTRQIREMVGQLQHGSSQTAEIMRSSREMAQQTVERTQNAQRSLSSISREVSAINDMNAQIATASAQQGVAVQDVSQNINRIHQASRQTSISASQVASSSHELAKLADSLTAKVSVFKVLGA